MKAFMDKDFLLESDTARELSPQLTRCRYSTGTVTCRPRKYMKTVRPRI